MSIAWRIGLGRPQSPMVPWPGWCMSDIKVLGRRLRRSCTALVSPLTVNPSLATFWNYLPSNCRDGVLVDSLRQGQILVALLGERVVASPWPPACRCRRQA